MILSQLREELAAAGHEIFTAGLTSRYGGNISVRDPESGLIAIKPSGVPWLEIQAEDVVIIDTEAKILDGNREPSIETPFHTAVYRAYQDVMALVHTHSTYATGFAVARRPIPAICVNSVELGGEVPVIEFCPPGSEALSRAVVEMLGSHPAALMSAHGALCRGVNLEEALYLSEILEETAHLAVIHTLLGSEATLSPDEIAAIEAI